MYDVTLGIFVYIKQSSAPLELMDSSHKFLKVQQILGRYCILFPASAVDICRDSLRRCASFFHFILSCGSLSGFFVVVCVSHSYVLFFYLIVRDAH
jgi:hypothetical protein